MYLACTSQSPPNYLACTWLGRLVTNHSWLRLALGPFPDFSVSAFQRFSFCQIAISAFYFLLSVFPLCHFIILPSAFYILPLTSATPGCPPPYFIPQLRYPTVGTFG